ncbi:hypothetical protein R50073_38910 [Maricurvus nonylphenolicus]|uniref:type II secretion system protein GspM n=1 Tax=Maricurvus nonylphenolicus TaxID=1008307 RepID=UPI0036F39362
MMNESLTNWFYRFSRREQYVLMAGAVVLILYVVYQLWLLPLQNRVDLARHQVNVVVDDLREVESLSHNILQARKQRSQQQRSQPVNLAELVDRSLRKSQLTMQTYQPGKQGEASVRLSDVSYRQLLAWLYELEQRQGLYISQFTMTTSASTSQVNATVGLSLGQPVSYDE